MSDLLQDHIHSPEPYEEDDGPPPSRARVQLKRDLSDMSMDEQSVMLMPDSTGEPFGMLDAVQRKAESAGDPPWAPQNDLTGQSDSPDTIQMKKDPGGSLDSSSSRQRTTDLPARPEDRRQTWG